MCKHIFFFVATLRIEVRLSPPLGEFHLESLPWNRSLWYDSGVNVWKRN